MVRNVLAVIGLLVVLVTFTPIDRWWTAALSGDWPDSHGRTLVVLGGSSSELGLVGYSSYWRALYSVLTWREGGWSRIVVVGRGVAAPLRDFLIYAGVPPEDIVMEDTSLTTRENALACARLLKQEPAPYVLLTSDFHMFRALHAFRKAGIAIQPRPIPDAGKRAVTIYLRWSAFVDLTAETVKVVYYAARGWT